MRLLATLLRGLAILIVSILVILFAINNRSEITLSLFPLPYEATLPLFLALIIGLLLGALLGGILVSLANLRMRRECARLRRRLHVTENELAGVKLAHPALP